MSKNRNNLFFINCIVVCFLVFTACSSRLSVVGSDPSSVKPSLETSKQKTPAYVQRVEKHFKRGEELVMSGDMEGAKYYFNRVMDILLDSGSQQEAGGQDRAIGHKKLLSYYIARISEIELSYLKDRVSRTGDQHNAFLEEVVATPLFKPSPHEIFKMREKMHHEKPKYSIPITINSRVVSFIKAFCNIRHKNIQNALNRSVEYIDEFKRIFKSYGVPEDLAYLPIIESGFRVNAVSRARARGVWQFMASTARLYGLRVDWVVDERRDPYKAAHAAAKLLKNLYKKYGDYYLALAAYNGGPSRVSRAVRRLKTKDFFRIARSRYIRRETRNYVPAFLASLIIAKDPQAHGFTIQGSEKYFHNTKSIEIPSPVSIKDVARMARVSYRHLQKINPELIREFTPFNKKSYTIRVPLELDPERLERVKRLPPAKRFFVGWYRVRRGDSLYSIARKFNTSVRKIKRANKLRSNLIRPGKRLLIPRGS